MGDNVSEISGFAIRPINPDGTYGDEIQLEGFGNITTYPAESLYDEDADLIKTLKFVGEAITFIGNIKLPHKKMSRKKFKKWLMHFPGMERNSAEGWCCLIGIAKGQVSYQHTYSDNMLFVPDTCSLMESILWQLKNTKK